MASKLDTAHVRNVGEFYSQHYLDAVLADDLDEVLERWTTRETEGGARAPYKRLAALAEKYFKALGEYLADDDRERRPQICADFHAALLDALGYERAPSPIALPDGTDLPRTLAIDHQGKPYLWVVEAPFPSSEDDADPLGASPLGLDTPEPDSLAPPSWRTLLDGPLLRQERGTLASPAYFA